MKKNAILSFLFACLPGFGQMYLGYMKRGLSLTLLFWGGIGVIAVLQLDVLLLIMIALWAYAFFDALNIRALSPEQRAVFYDDYIPSATWFKQSRQDPFFKRFSGSKLLAWVLIGIGLLLLYNTVLMPVLHELAFHFPALYSAFYRLPHVVLAVGVTVLGLVMLRGGKRRADKTPPDDITPFDKGQNDGG